MAQEVMLLKDVAGCGAEGEVVRVSEGYARNYLLPRKLAAPVTDATRRRLEKQRAARAAQEAVAEKAARELAARLEQVSCTLPVKTGEGGKMFGAITAPMIAGQLQKAHGIALEKHQLELAEPIKELGVFSLPVQLHPKVAATLKVWIVEE